MNEVETSSHWYAVYTRSHQEFTVSRLFQETGIEHYCPRFQQVHRWSDRRKKIDVPAFPGYLFVRGADTAEERRRVLQTQGVVRLLGQGAGPTPIPDAEVQAVRRLLESNLPCDGHALITEGALVRVRHGILKGLEGLLVRMRNQDRIVVSVEILGRSVSAEISSEDVEVLRSSAALPHHQ